MHFRGTVGKVWTKCAQILTIVDSKRIQYSASRYSWLVDHSIVSYQKPCYLIIIFSFIHIWTSKKKVVARAIFCIWIDYVPVFLAILFLHIADTEIAITHIHNDVRQWSFVFFYSFHFRCCCCKYIILSWHCIILTVHVWEMQR